MRRKDRQIEAREKIDAIIKGSRVCRVAMALDNQPYLVPLSFGYDGSAIYLHTARDGKKIGYFEAAAEVCFEFERNVRLVQSAQRACKWSLAYESVIGYGTIEEMLEPQDKKNGLNQIMLQYSGKKWQFRDADLAKTRVWKISITSITAKTSKQTTP